MELFITSRFCICPQSDLYAYSEWLCVCTRNMFCMPKQSVLCGHVKPITCARKFFVVKNISRSYLCVSVPARFSQRISIARWLIKVTKVRFYSLKYCAKCEIIYIELLLVAVGATYHKLANYSIQLKWSLI